MIHYNTLVVIAGVGLLGAGAGLVGTFAVLRGRALLGDALAHAALPGLCLAFLVVGSRNLPAMLLGALLSGVVGVAIITALRTWTIIREDAAVGIVLSVFFGAGIVLSRLIQNRNVEASKAGLDSYILGKTAGMTLDDVLFIAAIALAELVLIVLLFKEYQLVMFDPGFARSAGWPAPLLDLSLMVLVAVTVVLGLPAVGALLTSALLILPAAAARFWTERLSVLLALSAGLGAGIGVVGVVLSAQSRWTPAGPIIVLVGAAVFLVAMVTAPRRGLITQWLARRRWRRNLLDRRLLADLYDWSESALPNRPWYSARDRDALIRGEDRAIQQRWRLFVVSGWIEEREGQWRLAELGWREATIAARKQRLLDQVLDSPHPELLSARDFEDLEDAQGERSSRLQQELLAQGRWPEGLGPC